MNKNLKRKLYALALSGILLVTPKVHAHAEDIDMSPIDIDSAISDLVPDYTEASNSNENTNVDNSNNESNEVKNVGTNVGNQNNTNNYVEEPTTCAHLFSDVADDVRNQVTPSCTTGGSYDEVFNCVKCGAEKIVHHEVAAPGHAWGEPKIENQTSTGYDSVRECTNKGCHERITTHVDIITPTEPTIPTIPTEPGTNPKTGDNSNLGLALAAFIASDLGLVGVTGYSLYEKMRESLEQPNTKKNKGGKYLSKTK